MAFAGTDVILNVVLQDFLPIIPGLTSLGMFITDLFFVFVITRYKVFDLVTIAHEDIINTIPHGILVLDEEESVIETNRALHLFVDIEVGDTFDIETLLSSVRTGDNLQHFIAQYKLRETDLSEIELFSEQRNLHFILQTSPIFDAKRIPLGHIFIFRDVTQERSLVQELNRQNELLHEQNRSLDRTRLDLSLANRRLEELALTDSLTHCYNRYYLTQRLSQELNATAEQRLPFSLILFDIDFFKTINDRYGHVAGDEVLYRTAQAVKQCIRSTDILARYGGEEFMLYLPYTNNKTAKKIAEQVRYAVESNMVHLEQLVEPISVTVSVGVLSIQDLHHVQIGENMKEYLNFLFSEVDKPLYRAKKNGRNRVELADMTPLPDWPFKQSAHNN
ncbi:GGDEF domain-containing protein [Saccharibacillus kuerlensis]|uniref:GGDEF domain-containing protein n=1 Tax=Saccharibacillus kuerlensis TaxID=459527 RepID=A0ABQ2KRZ5_9BACL|nr:GGDEF domain-containing protein [Saccharibacillus kuerlensis]